MPYVLQTHNLSKKYKRQFAVDQVNMNIEKGDIYGFVGENGSGKTTIIRLITGLIQPHSGGFTLFGVSDKSSDITRVRRNVGAIVESPSIYRNMSAYENLTMQCRLVGVSAESRVEQVLTEVGLQDVIHDKKRVANFSLGMRQRLGIAMALLSEPEFLILDEPMNGLDPAGIVEVRELILRLNREKGITFLISSHILTELQLVATKYGIISKGKLIQEITAQQLHQQCGKTTVIEVEDPSRLLSQMQTMWPACEVTAQGEGVSIVGEIDLNETLKAIVADTNPIRRVQCTEGGVEEYYLSLIGGGNRG